MKTGDWIAIPCIQIEQPIGRFYIGVVDSKALLDISHSDIIRIDRKERQIETVSGLERPISPSRVKELREYVKSVDATFPSGVILSISSEDVEYYPDTCRMRIRHSAEVAEIIDGQHRIEGLRGFAGAKFEVNVTIFVDIDTEDQAMVFSIINLKQSPVHKSITYELFEYAKSRSPQKTCHSIARALNHQENSPFRDKIMILGVADDKQKETLTQAAFIKPLLRLITLEKQAMADRDALKRNRFLSIPTPEEIRSNSWVFRKWFIQDQDVKIAQTVGNYFLAVSRRWPRAWKEKQPRIILNRTNGYNALMRFLPLLMFRLGLDQVHSVDEFEPFFNKVSLEDNDFNTERFTAGSSGEGHLLQKLTLDTGISKNEAWKQIAQSSE
jgi:DGQHR domain-containing protein